MTDAEVLCAWMEPRPTTGKPEHGSNEVWWRWGWRYVGPSLPQKETPVEYCWLPIRLTLNECHLIEEKLTKEQWNQYLAAMPISDMPFSISAIQVAVHLRADLKIAALASVLRPLVEVEG